MALNPYFNFHGQNGPQTEFDLYKKLHREVIQIHGCTFLYVKRELTNMDRLFGEDLSSAFKESYEIEAWIETYDGFEGDGALITRLGLTARDEMRLVVSAEAFTENTGMRVPREGDIIFNRLNNEVFEIKFFDHEKQFYPLGGRMSYILKLETLETSREKIDIPEINDVIGDNVLKETPEEALTSTTDNVIIQDESTPIIDFSEKSPFGDY